MAEKIRFNCTCGKSLSADLESAGGRVDCPRCGETLHVPAPAWAEVAGEIDEDDAPSASFTSGKFMSAGGAPRSLAPTPNVNAVRSKGDSLWGNSDDFLEQQNLASKCPTCGASMSSHAVVCLVCGHNKQAKKSNAALASDTLSLNAALPASGHVASPAHEQDSGGGGTKLLIGGLVVVCVLGVGAFFSKPIGLAAVFVGFVSLVLGIGTSIVGGIAELSQNVGARRNLLHSVLLTVLFGPLGFVVLRRDGNRPYSRMSNLGRLLVLFGLPLMMLGSFGIAKQAAHRRRPAKPALKAPQWPAEAEQRLKQRAKR